MDFTLRNKINSYKIKLKNKIKSFFNCTFIYSTLFKKYSSIPVSLFYGEKKNIINLIIIILLD